MENHIEERSYGQFNVREITDVILTSDCGTKAVIRMEVVDGHEVCIVCDLHKLRGALPVLS